MDEVRDNKDVFFPTFDLMVDQRRVTTDSLQKIFISASISSILYGYPGKRVKTLVAITAVTLELVETLV